MKWQIRSILVYIFEPKLIIFGVALSNFVSLWTASSAGCAGIACPWYYDWSYLNEPSLLFPSGSFLLFGKWWSNIISFLLSGFVLIRGVFLITKFGGWSELSDSLSRRWQFVQEYKLETMKEWEIQLILAVIFFSFALFHSIQESFYKKTAQSEFV